MNADDPSTFQPASDSVASSKPNASTDGPSGDDYVVVARRYRPQAFDELIGQGHVAKGLKQAISSGRVGHAYLFTGARGVGKTSCARILAKALNCEKGPADTPCNVCDVCVSVSTGDDMDVLEIDGASNRGIDEIRLLRQNASVRPSRSRFKIYIIDEVHMLTKEAFNALLKTLEEPPEHVKFIFATTEPNKIPITILSRCQRFDFAGIESTSIQQRLAQIAEAEGVSIDSEALQILGMRAAGSMRDSQSLLEQLLAVASEAITAADVNNLLGIAPAQRIGDLAQALADRQAGAALSELDAAVNGGADVGQLIDQLLGYFRDVMALCVGCDPSQMIYALPGQASQVQAIGSQMGVQTVLALLQVLDQTAARLRVSMHSRTLAEMAVVRACQLADLDDLASLIASLEEGGLPSTGPSTRPQARPTARQQTSVPPAHPEPQKKSDATGVATPPITSAAKPSSTQAPSPAAVEQSVAEAGAPVIPAPQPTTQSTPEANTTPEISQVVASAGPAPVSMEDALNAKLSEADASPAPNEVQGTSVTMASPAEGGGLAEQMQQLAQKSDNQTAPVRRISRRQQQSEVAEKPFVKEAIRLFDVEPDKIRYTPPRPQKS